MGKTIEIDDNFEHHVRAWRIKRVCWVLMLLVIGAALAGFLGPGPYSQTSIQGPGGLRLEYDRISRYNAPAQFRLAVPAGKDSLELSINSNFLGKIDLERIDPEPTEMRLAGENHTWIFARSETNQPSEIRIAFRPGAFGSAPARIEIRGIGTLEVKPFFLP